MEHRMLNEFKPVYDNFESGKYKFQLNFANKKSKGQTESEALFKLREDLESCVKNIEGSEKINLYEIWALVSSYLYRSKNLRDICNLYIKITKNMIEKNNSLGRAFVEES